MNLKVIGGLFGLLSAITWALDNLLISKMLQTNIIKNEFSSMLAIAFFKELFFFGFAAVFSFQETKSILRKQFIFKKKNFYLLAVIGLLTTVIGGTSYVAAIHFVGGSIAGAITSAYPMLVAIIVVGLKMESLKKTSIVGFFLIIVGLFCKIDFIPIYNSIFCLGILCALITAFGYALESILISYLSLDKELSTKAILVLKGFWAIVAHLLITFPLLIYFSNLEVMLSKNFFSLVTLAALNAFISYYCYYRSIIISGATIATSFNILYVFFIPLFSIIFYKIPTSASYFDALWSIVVVIGVVIIVSVTKKAEHQQSVSLVSTT